VTALLPQADSERAGQAKRYLKSDLDFLGVSVPAIRSAVRDVARTHRELDRDGALAWARALWREPVHERRTAAIEVLRWYTRRLLASDLALVEAWVREAHGWAYVDPLAGDIAGPIALVHPDAWPLIDAWATDDDFWVRRSALLTLLPGSGGEASTTSGSSGTPRRCWPRRSSSLGRPSDGCCARPRRKIRPTWPRGRGVTWVRCPA
jgi:Predicted DNA alkylation repair enzyme